MGIPTEALEFENRSLGVNGEPTLAAAYKLLRDAWRSGERDRELGLHLLLLSWYMLIEPPHLTGLDEQTAPELAAVFNEVHDVMAPAKHDDAELLYVVGLMTSLAPWLVGDHDVWEWQSAEYGVLYRQLAPGGLDPSIFAKRGAYGEYFAGQARVGNGF
jgi:hypothetical protein